MKKNLSIPRSERWYFLFLISFLTIGINVANAYDFQADGIYYSYNGEGTVAVVSGDVKYKGVIKIPEEVSNSNISYRVTEIGDNAFYYCNFMTSVTIPNSVTKIGDQAFMVCTALIDITIGDSVLEIGDRAFGTCSALTTFKIPKYIKDIPEYCFSYCHSLENIEIPEEVVSIGNFAFHNCTKLKEINIPKLVEQIGDSAFSECQLLETITVDPENLFYSSNDGILYDKEENMLIICPGAKISAIIPEGVTLIKSNAFSSCTMLTEINIPNSVKTIESRAFQYCSSLEKIKIPDSVNSIGEFIFNGCKAITEIDLSNSLTIIPTSAFEQCTSLKSINLPDFITIIGDRCFQGCENLTSITFPKEVSSIGTLVFNRCTSLKEINVEEGNNYYASLNGILYDKDYSLLLVCPTTKTSVQIPETVITIQEYAFMGCKNLEILTFGDAVKEIQRNAFSNCESLKSVTLPNSVEVIGERAFYECTTLTNLTFGESLTTIGESAFLDCFELKELIIPNSIKEIGDVAFQVCYNLTDVTIGKSLKKLGKGAFLECQSLTNVTCLALDVPEIDDSFPPFFDVRNLYVYSSVLEKYKSSNWASCFENILPIEDESIPVDYIEITGYGSGILVVGETRQLSVIVTPENATDQDIVWESDDESLATVSQTGLVEAKKVGKVTIYARLKNDPSIKSECVFGINEKTSEIDSVVTDQEGKYHVYTSNGIYILSTSDIEDFQKLKTGIYIVNGRKILIQY